MAADIPMAMRRRSRRRQQHGAGEAPSTPAPASQRRSSRASAARKPATTKPSMPRTAGKAPRSKKSKASVPEPATAASGGADDAADDSVTLVDDADDSITALDFDIPISSRRSSGASTNTRKRRSSVTSNPAAIKRARRQTGSNNDNNNSSIVHILPLRTQILDDHIKRRIRRNGLSAEMNDAYGEKRARRERTLAELRRARDELRDRDAEIGRLRELTALFDHSSHHQGPQQHDDEGEASRVQDLEMELERLRGEVLGRTRGGEDLLTSSPPVPRGDDDGWGVMGGLSDGGSDAGGDFAHDFDDEEFGDTSLAELESGGTPGQHRHHRHQQQKSKGKRPTALHLHGPSLTPPSTSPTKLPSSPVRQIHSSNGSASTACDAGVQAASTSTDAASQACIPDPEIEALNGELSTLRAEVTSLNETLLGHDALQARVGEKLARHHHTVDDDDQDVELQLDIVLQDLAEKTERLGALSALLMPSSPTDSTSTTDDNKEATAELASALQSVRDALADLDTDNKTTTPLPPSAAPTLAMAATRLRDLDTALRQRTTALSDRDAALTKTNQDLAAARAEAAEKEARAKNLSADVANLAETISALRDEVELLSAAGASRQADLDSARDAALQQKTAAAEAEARLGEAVARVALLNKQLLERESELRGSEGQVETLRKELAEAGTTIARLREGAARERGASRDVVRAMRAQMMAALRVGEGFLGDDGVAKEEEESVVGVVGGGMDKADRGRSDDSGLGLEGEGEGLELA